MRIFAFCSGTGRTGKTVVAESLQAKGWMRHMSPTRAFFKSKGINSEGDLFARTQPERALIQREYFEFFLEDLEKVIDNSDEKTNIVFERSPVDMFSYLLFHDWSMKMEEYDAYMEKITQLLERVSKKGVPSIVIFPFPTEWMKTVDTDAFRHSMFGKDMVIHAIVQNVAMDVWDKIPSVVDICVLEDTTVEKRTQNMIQHYENKARLDACLDE